MRHIGSHAVGMSKFAAVGTVGFVIDIAVLYFVISQFGLDLYSGRVSSYLAAATTTWWLNRIWTFQSVSRSYLREWFRFIVLNSGGGVVNYIVYASLVSASEQMMNLPAYAVAAGSVSGMAVNYVVSSEWVFRLRRFHEEKASASKKL
jgi:putative flippase GtrA